MATIVRTKEGSWRVQVRRKGKYASQTFRLKTLANEWAVETERLIDLGGEPSSHRIRDLRTIADLVDLHIADLHEVGRPLSPQQLFAWRRSARQPLAEAPEPEPLFVPAVIAAPELEPSGKRARSTRKRKAARDAGVIELEIDGVAMRVGRGADARTVAAVNRALHDYASLYRQTYGESESVAELIPFMLSAFLESDRAFTKARRESLQQADAPERPRRRPISGSE